MNTRAICIGSYYGATQALRYNTGCHLDINRVLTKLTPIKALVKLIAAKKVSQRPQITLKRQKATCKIKPRLTT